LTAYPFPIFMHKTAMTHFLDDYLCSLLCTKHVSWSFNFENIQHTRFTYIIIWDRKLDSNSLTKTKNWSGRNEVTETSGRLHPLWPQNKWLHTPRTTDYRHTRQDEYRRNWLSHLQRMPQNRIPLNHSNTDHKEGEQLEDRRKVGASSCNCEEGTDQKVQSLMFMMMMMIL